MIRIDIIFGTARDKNGQPISLIRREIALERITGTAAMYFGKYAWHQSRNAWYRHDGGIQTDEPCSSLMIFTDRADYDMCIADLISDIKIQLDQEDVLATKQVVQIAS